MKCLILAAGKGSRLSNKGLPKPLVSVLGKSLIERVILTAKACGITDFLVVTGYQGKAVRGFLDELQEREDISIIHVLNEQWDKENGLSALKARPYLHEPFLLTMCDHLFTEDTLRALKDTPIGGGEVLVCVDHEFEHLSSEEVAEATKVFTQKGKVLDISKQLQQYNGIDTGLFLCTPALFDALEKAAEEGDTTLSRGIKVLATQGRVRAFDMGGAPWFDVDDENSLQKAQQGLLRLLKKDTDGPVSRYLNRPISLRLTRYLVTKDLSPNQISFISFMAAIVAGLCFALKGHVALIFGALLAQFSSVIDGCDGEVARLKFQMTEFGGWFDAVLDRYADACILFGLTLHLIRTDPGLGSVAAGYFALTGSLINSYTARRYDVYLRKKQEGRPVAFRLGRDVRILIVFLGALLDKVFATLVIIALIMNLENIRRIWVLYGAWQRRKGH